MTMASLGNLGYRVNLNAVEPFELLDPLAMAERALLMTEATIANIDIMLPTVPTVLAESSMQ